MALLRGDAQDKVRVAARLRLGREVGAQPGRPRGVRGSALLLLPPAALGHWQVFGFGSVLDILKECKVALVLVPLARRGPLRAEGKSGRVSVGSSPRGRGAGEG